MGFLEEAVPENQHSLVFASAAAVGQLTISIVYSVLLHGKMKSVRSEGAYKSNGNR